MNVLHGKADTAQGWLTAVPGGSIVNDLVTSTTGTLWVRETNIWSMLTVYTYTIMRAATLGANALNYGVAVFCAELLAFDIPGNKQCPVAQVDDLVIGILFEAFPLTRQGMTAARLNAAFQQVPALHKASIPVPPNWGAANHADITAMIPDANAAWGIMETYARATFANNSQATLTSLFVAFLSAVAKMGNITDRFVDKVANRLRDEIALDISHEIVSMGVIKMVWSAISQFVNENNMAIVCQRWVGYTDANGHPVQGVIPAYALSLRITVQQIKGEGLTAICTIKRALAATPGFDWPQVFAYFPGEATAIQNAIAAIGDNAYYGYVQDTSVIKSTNYKNVAWVAKELLIKLGGNHSLTHYRGWTRTPMYRVALDTLIDNYINNIPIPATPGVPTQHATAIAAAMQQATGIVV